MGILDDVTDAVITYPRDYLEVEIINVNPPGSELNVGEDALFTFQVANNGPLDVKDLTLKVEGLNGTTVKANGAAAQWEPSHTSRVGYFPTVPAHSNGPNDPGPVVAPGIEWHFKRGDQLVVGAGSGEGVGGGMDHRLRAHVPQPQPGGRRGQRHLPLDGATAAVDSGLTRRRRIDVGSCGSDRRTA